MNLHDRLATVRYQELEEITERQRLLAALSANQHSILRHSIARMGVVLIKIGMRLKQVETGYKPHSISPS
jgi:hypothetical protein